MKYFSLLHLCALGLLLWVSPYAVAADYKINSGGTAVITLDNGDDLLTITNGDNQQTIIVDHNGTTDTLNGVKSLSINGRGGENSVSLLALTIERDITIRSANVSALFTSVGRKLTIVSGTSDDTVDLANVDVSGTSSINTGNGNDTIVFNNFSVAGKFQLLTGSGSDTVSMRMDSNSAYDANATMNENGLVALIGQANINTGAGDDTIYLDGITVLGRMGIVTASGLDSVTMRDNVFSSSLVVNTGAHNDKLNFAGNTVAGRTELNGAAGSNDAYRQDKPNSTGTPYVFRGFETENYAPSPFIENYTLAAQWNELALAAVRSGSAKPTIVTWQMFVFSAAMYDAIAIYTPNSKPYALTENSRRPSNEFTDENKREAASQAAYQVLTQLFSTFEQQEGYFHQYLTSLGYVDTSAVDESPSSQGYQAAIAVLSSRASDGSNSANNFTPTTSSIYPELYVPVNSPDPISSVGIFGEHFNPNAWQPLRVPNGTLLNEEELAIVDDLNLNSFGDQTFLTSHWGAVTPFALSSGSEFRPTGPPMLNSDAPYTDATGTASSHDAAYRQQVQEVIEHSANLTDRHKIIAEFWADGPRTESPPGHWNQIAHGVVERDELSLVESSQLFFALNGALLDAGIATWEAKRFYNYIRPASAIRWLHQNSQILAWGGPNKGTDLILGNDWSPYQALTFVTPPFPEYVSGHSSFSRAAAEVLTRFTGHSGFYDGETRTSQDLNGDGESDVLGEFIAPAGSFMIEEGPAENVVLQWNTYFEAADEAGKSRIYGGIHIQDGDLRGRELGRKIGERAFERAMAYASGEI